MFLQDLRYGLRLLRKNPGFAILAVTIMALGIGANSAIFSAVNGVLLNPLPYRDPDRVVVIWSDYTARGGAQRQISYPADVLAWRDQSRSFQSLAVFNNESLTFTGLDQPVTPLTHVVTNNYFNVLGVRALHGRTFVAGEGEPGKDRVAIISHHLWQNAFGGDVAAVGRRIELDGMGYQLVGVLPPGFHSPNNFAVQPDLWVPFTIAPLREVRGLARFGAVARLRAGASVADAQAELSVISRRLAQEYPDSNAGIGAMVQPIRDVLVGQFRTPFRLLLVAVGLVFLIACANVANLLLARATGRAQEIALRTAIGAGRRRILAQLLTEGALLSGLGAALGLLAAPWAVRPLLALVPASAGLPFVDSIVVDARVAAFAAGLSLLTGLLFGLAPAWQAARLPVGELLKEGGRSGSAGRRSGWARNALVAGQVALSVILLAGAGLLIQSSWRLSQAPPGFDPAQVLTVRNSLRGDAYVTPVSRRRHFQEAIAKIEALPGVVSAAAVSFPPPASLFTSLKFVRPEQPATPGREPTALAYVVTPKFFATLGIPVLSGRSLSEQDSESAPLALVVSRKFADTYFPGENPLERTIRLQAPGSGLWKIVGVVGDLRAAGADPAPRPMMFMPHAQRPLAIMTFVIRTSSDPMNLAAATERAIWSLGRTMNVYQVRPIQQLITESYWQTRFTTVLLAGFASLALLLAAAGVYGVVSYSVAQRTREIGIRMTLGATRATVLKMVVQQGLTLTAAGVALGAVGSLALNRLLAGLLYGVTPGDPATIAGVGLGLAIVSAGACAVPAWRAAAVDPSQALHHQ